ncbi:hypothetical protein L6R52_19175 [Myxococcota bacterium]|nr:hypothetical protein [Myxococcota bacterium]
MTEEKTRNLGMPLDAAREQLLRDPSTTAIAKSLGVDVAQYVDMVLDFARHPDKQPELHVLDEEELEEQGASVPSPADVTRWLDGVARGEIAVGPAKVHEHDGFTTQAEPEQVAREVAGLAPAEHRAPTVEETTKRKGAAPVAPATGLGAVLRSQVLEQQQRALLTREAKTPAGRPAPGRDPKK